jgi:hypothetical protein
MPQLPNKDRPHIGEFDHRDKMYTVYVCNGLHTNIGNMTTLLKPHNIGTHLKGIETSFQILPHLGELYHLF